METQNNPIHEKKKKKKNRKSPISVSNTQNYSSSISNEMFNEMLLILSTLGCLIGIIGGRGRLQILELFFCISPSGSQ